MQSKLPFCILKQKSSLEFNLTKKNLLNRYKYSTFIHCELRVCTVVYKPVESTNSRQLIILQSILSSSLSSLINRYVFSVKSGQTD